jgi:hypothetical protein
MRRPSSKSDPKRGVGGATKTRVQACNRAQPINSPLRRRIQSNATACFPSGSDAVFPQASDESSNVVKFTAESGSLLMLMPAANGQSASIAVNVIGTGLRPKNCRGFQRLHGVAGQRTDPSKVRHRTAARSEPLHLHGCDIRAERQRGTGIESNNVSPRRRWCSAFRNTHSIAPRSETRPSRRTRGSLGIAEGTKLSVRSLAEVSGSLP